MSDLTAFPINARWPAADPSVIQLYSYPTPNGVKVSIALEELGLAYEPHLITLADADVKYGRTSAQAQPSTPKSAHTS